MKKKNSKDKLEDLFRNLFNDSRKGYQPDGWNMPPEDAWNNIQNGLGKEEKEERKFLYWHWVAIAASILLLGSVFQLYQSNKQIQKLSNKIIKNDLAVQKVQADLQALNEQKIEGIQVTESQSEQLSNPKHNQAALNSSVYREKERTIKEITAFNNNSNAANSAIISKSANHSSLNKKLGEVILKAEIAVTAAAAAKKVRSNQNKDLNASILQKERTLNIISISDKLPTSITPLDLKHRTINWTSSIITPIVKRPSFYVAVDYAPVMTNVKDKGAKLDKHEFFPRREIQEKAFTTGLQFGIKLNKGWSLETGLHYSSIEKSIRHNRIIPYQSLQERLNDNGDFESNINLQLGSAEGAVDTDISLARSAASTVASDANINMDIAFISDRSYLDVPLIVKKEWGIGSFELSLKAGLLNRFLLTKSFELQHITLDDGRFKSTTNNFRERPNSRSKTNYTGHYLAGVGLEYTFRPGQSFYLEPTFIRSMQSVISPRGASIYTKSKMLNVGLRYML